MPEAAPLSKVAGTKALGAEVILKGDNFDEAYAYALEYAKENKLSYKTTQSRAKELLESLVIK